MLTIPKTANITDIRYSWTQLIAEIEKNQEPLIILDRSRPKAVLFPMALAEKIISFQGKQETPPEFIFKTYRLGKVKRKINRDYIYE